MPPTPPSFPDLVYNRRGSWHGDTYVSPAGIDTWNESQMAKYNNEYNYWLWQQEREYNSPVNQRARLEAAGLNPNFNSIDGAGNVAPTPSRASISSSVGPVANQSLAQMVNTFNSVIGAISQGVNMTRTISQIPSDINQNRENITKYFDALRKSKEWDALSAEAKSELNKMEAMFKAYTFGQDVRAPFAGYTRFGETSVGPDGNPKAFFWMAPDREGAYHLYGSHAATEYRAQKDYEVHRAAYMKAHSILEGWRSSGEVTDLQKQILDRQLEILGVDKQIRDWVVQTKEVALALNIIQGFLDVAVQSYGVGKLLK